MKRLFILLFFSQFAFGQDIQLKEAESFYSEGNYENAYIQFKDIYFAKSAFTEYVDTHLRMVDCQIHAGNPFHAKSLAENTLTFIENETPNENILKARTLTLLGLSHLNLGHNDEALEVLLEAEQLRSQFQ